MNLNELRVYLRSFEPDDYLKTHSWRNDEEVWSLLVGRRYYVSSAYEKRWVEDAINENQNDIRLAVCLKENHKHIGNAYLNRIDWFNRSAVSGILIGDKQYWGKGFGTEAKLLLLNHGFNDLGLIRIWSEFLKSNHRSVRYAEKCGYKKEGILRQACFKNGSYEDLVVMAVLKDEFFAITNKK